MCETKIDILMRLIIIERRNEEGDLCVVFCFLLNELRGPAGEEGGRQVLLRGCCCHIYIYIYIYASILTASCSEIH